MLEYILKSGACLAFFWFFYKLFLELESIHVFKRYYLLLALLLSFVIPLLVFRSNIEATIEMDNNYTYFSEIILSAKSGASQNSDISSIARVLWIIYALVSFFFGYRFSKNLFLLIQKVRNNSKYRLKKITYVLLPEVVIPHTFCNYIFLNKDNFEKHEIPKAVLLHEEIHAQQKHSMDVLFIELVQVIFWFNPFILLIKRAIKLNHEFLADKAVVRTGISPNLYKNILLAFTSNALMPPLANSINYSLIKKRFTIMKTQTSKKSILIRSIMLLPLLALLLYGFSDTMAMQVQNSSLVAEHPKSVQEKATPELIAEYNGFAKKFNTMIANYGNIFFEKSEVDRMKYIYGIMTEEQKSRAEPFPNFPPIPEPPVPPSQPEIPMEAQKELQVSPPSPKVPNTGLKYIIEMTNKNAIFLYKGNEISSNKAIEILKKNKEININTRAINRKRPVVVLSNGSTTIDDQ